MPINQSPGRHGLLSCQWRVGWRLPSIIKRGGTPMFMRLTAMALVFVSCLAGWGAGLSKSEFALESTIAFTSTRDNPAPNPLLAGAGEIYLMSPDGTNLRRLTENTAVDS